MMFLLGIISIFFMPSQKTLTPQELFTYHIANPIPSSVSNLVCTYYFDPTLGDGAFEIRFKIKSKDLGKIVTQLHKQKLDLESFRSTQNSNYSGEFIGFLGQDISIFTHKYDKFSSIRIYTNKEMTKVIARHHGFINNNPITKHRR